ncbi:putative nardilysin [Rosa chinensis]|uniref:Putative nardilysin n=1 Tax=Rosa chinensis TaxID=74649 RepID=A0A2P6QL52_ROSCH|nr:putative nardilysin [Rosa chinensis]
MVHYPEIGDSQLSEGSEEAEEEEGMEEEDEEDEDCEGEDEDDEGEDEDELKKKKGGDSQTKKVAMCAGIGSFCDPPEAQGLAHFLEHMLFMGSTEFADEKEYDSYLSKHGGCLNAYTEVEHTCYHFEVKREFLKGALTRFSQFFVSPLVKIEAMERELQAVDSGACYSCLSLLISVFPFKKCPSFAKQ